MAFGDMPYSVELPNVLAFQIARRDRSVEEGRNLRLTERPPCDEYREMAG